MSEQEAYTPACFNVDSAEQARAIILTPQDSTTDDRWAVETPYQVALAAEHLPLGDDTVILDYGCGIGRLARELITEFGCRVIGVDISASMRTLAEQYVGSDRFRAVSPEELDGMIADGLACDAAYSVWVLQHCQAPDTDIDRIHRALKPEGSILVINNLTRSVPVSGGFVNDGIDVRILLDARFSTTAAGQPDATFTPERLARSSFWVSGQRR